MRGARQTLLDNGLPPVFFEHDEKWLKRARTGSGDVFAYLRELGYGLFLNKHWETHEQHPENNVLALARPWTGARPRLHRRARRLRDIRAGREREQRGGLLEERG